MLLFGEVWGLWPKIGPKFSTQKVALTTEAKRRILLLKIGVGSALGAEGLPPSESPSGLAVIPALPESLAPSVTPFFALPEGLSFCISAACYLAFWG